MPLSPERAASATRVAILVLAAAVVLIAPAARAAPGTSAEDRQARELFQKAEMSFNLGKFGEALTSYQAAYQAKPLPALLFNVAQCYRNLENYERARFFFRRYLDLDARTTNRRMVEDLIAEMTAKMAKSGPVAPLSTSAAEPDAADGLKLAAAPTAAPGASVDLARAGAGEQRPQPLYKHWWFWAGVAGVAAGAIAVGLLASRSETPHGSLGTIDGR
jgi:tetratricopeptide (TPR) repeat protein